MRLSATSKDKIIIAAMLPATLSHRRLVTAPGDTVGVKDFRRKGAICQRARPPPSYVVDIENGVQIERNRKMLVKQTPSRVQTPTTSRKSFLLAWKTQKLATSLTLKPSNVSAQKIAVICRCRGFQANMSHDLVGL
ncbi:hypothetical protein MTO96_004609 [Rhipicephalus appendiculatus]